MNKGICVFCPLARREPNGGYTCWHVPNEGVDVELINCPKNENSSN